MVRVEYATEILVVAGSVDRGIEHGSSGSSIEASLE
jgi:hypothetical protein